MMIRAVLWVIAVSMTTSLANAQGVHRIVGPDGKVTYSDQPPSEGNGPVGIAAPSATPRPAVPAPQASRSNSPSTYGPKQVAMREPSAESSAVSTPSKKELEGAIIGVLGINSLITQAQKICLASKPESAKEFMNSRSVWDQRNGETVRLAHRALNENYSSAEQKLIQGALELRNSSTLAVVRNAAEPQKKKWCDLTVAEIQQGKLDVYNNPRLAGRLLASR